MGKILFGVPPKNHVKLALDEVQGFEELGYDCKTITYTRNQPNINKFTKFIGVLSNALAISKKLKELKPDILYLNSRFDKVCVLRDSISIFLIRFFYHSKLAIVIKTHGSKIPEKSFIRDKLIIPYLTKQVSLWFFLSEEEKNNIYQYAPKMGVKSFVTFNIINPERSIPSSSLLSVYGIDSSKFCFLFVGRLIEGKGIFSIVEGISKFSEKEHCRFIFIGSGKDGEALKALAKKRNVEKYTHFLGFIPEEECDHFYANVDALVFPSWEEGFAMALFKSVCAGLPVITTKIRAAKDQLKEPDNCIWVGVKSDTDIVVAFEKIYKSKELRATMSRNNRLLGAKYTREMVCLDMHGVFEKHL